MYRAMPPGSPRFNYIIVSLVLSSALALLSFRTFHGSEAAIAVLAAYVATPLVIGQWYFRGWPWHGNNADQGRRRLRRSGHAVASPRSLGRTVRGPALLIGVALLAMWRAVHVQWLVLFVPLCYLITVVNWETRNPAKIAGRRAE